MRRTSRFELTRSVPVFEDARPRKQWEESSRTPPPAAKARFDLNPFYGPAEACALAKQVPILESFAVCSGILKNDGFEHVGNIFRLVGRGFQELEQFLDFDQGDGIGLIFEEARDGDPGYLVGFIFQAVDFHAVSENVVALLQVGYGLLQFFALGQNEPRQLPRLRRRLRNSVHDNSGASSIDEVDDVVQGGGQGVNVLSVERCDECLV